jgi:hypothetical protein
VKERRERKEKEGDETEERRRTLPLNHITCRWFPQVMT